MNINQNNIKAWTIPEGAVFKVVDSNNVTLWERPYVEECFAINKCNPNDSTALVVSIDNGTGISHTFYYSWDNTVWYTLTNSGGFSYIDCTIHNKLYIKHDGGLGRLSSGNPVGVIFFTNTPVYLTGNASWLINQNGPNSITSDSDIPVYAFYNTFINNFFIDAHLMKMPLYTNNRCCYRMFYNNTGLLSAPILPATQLTTNCYQDMFRGCSRLNYISCAATQNIVTYTGNWVNGVQTTSGTFICPSSVEPGQPNGWTYGNDGIPMNWDVNP